MITKNNFPFSIHVLDSSRRTVDILKKSVSDLNSNQLLLCNKGSITFECEEQTMTVTEHCLLIHTPMRIYHFLRISDDFDGTFWMSHEQNGFVFINRVLDMSTQLSVISNPLLKMEEQAFDDLYKKTLELKRLISIFNETNIVQQSMDILYRLVLSIVQTIGYAICFMFSIRNDKRISNVSNKDIITMKFLASLNKNYIKERTVKFYASEQSMQSSYFSSIIKSKTGRTAANWIDYIIITHSKEMLLWQEIRIKEVSEKLHFPSQSFFGKFFKKHVGMSPKEFRKLKMYNQ